MYETMSTLDLAINFGDAGACAAKFLDERTASARQRQRYFADVKKGTRFLVVFAIAVMLSFGYHNPSLRAMSALLSLCGMGFALYLRQSASYYAWLLKVASPIDDFLANINRMDLCPAARKWIEAVRTHGRDIYCFDLEIMAMMNEAHLLRPQGATTASFTPT
jgi:hypothetical protein